MTSEEFIEVAKNKVRKYTNDTLDKTDLDRTDAPLTFDVFVVWFGYVLGNQKALLSTTLPDRMYYEITYNKDKNECYFDAYTKIKNEMFKN